MSGICGCLGVAQRSVLEAMLSAIDYRGERTEIEIGRNAAFGYRWFPGRAGRSPGIFRAGRQMVVCAGTLAPAVASPAEELHRLLSSGDGLEKLDGAFAAAYFNAERDELTLIRDPFGIRSVYFVEHAGLVYFASELKQLLRIPGLSIELDPVALHKYLAFSFVPGKDLPIRGVRRLLPGHLVTFRRGELDERPYFKLSEELDEKLADRQIAILEARRLFRAAIAGRLAGEQKVGVFLSGGIDSSAVAAGLKHAGADVSAFSLDFGEMSVEKPQAEAVARTLEIPLELVRVDGETILRLFEELVWRLDLPFGDPVTGPQFVLARAARKHGLETVFNGEGGDQLFGGWTSKPMIAAELYQGLYEQESREETYLKSYHRFYGLEDELYTAEFREAVGGPGQRRAQLAPFLQSNDVSSFLGRVRLADIALKGSQNIVPRAERMANAWGLDVRMPLFDRKLAEFSFRLPPQLKLLGSIEKWVFKRAVRKYLPREIVWRKKSGMCVPITDWLLGPLAPLVEELLDAGSLERRGLFRHAYVDRLRRGENEPGETRRRRVGERLWTLVMLEAWLRVFVDAKGKRAS